MHLPEDKTDKSTCWPEQERCRAIENKWLRVFEIKDETLTLVLMGLFLAMGRVGRLSPLVIGKPPTVFTSTNSFLLATGLGTGAGWEEEEDEEASEIRDRLLSSEGLEDGIQERVDFGGDRRSLDSPPMLSFLDTFSGPLGSVVGVMLVFLTGLLTMGTTESGMFQCFNG